jgi:succinoglycan biosynthesis protein ExoH
MGIAKDVSSRFELCRFLSIAFIVFIHTPEPGRYGQAFSSDANTFLLYFVQGFGRAAGTATLSMMSGYFFFRSFHAKSFSGIMRTKLRTLLIPGVLWAIIFTAVAFLFQYTGVTDPNVFQLYPPNFAAVLDAVIGLDMGPLNYPVFFLYDLFTCILFAPIFYFVYRRAAWIGFAALFAALLLNQALIPTVRPDIAFNFFVGGLLAHRQISPSWFDRTRWLWIPLFAAACLVYALVGLAHGFGDEHRHNQILNAVRLLGPPAVWSISGLLLGTGVGRLFLMLAPASFFIFCSHWNFMQLAGRFYYGKVPGSIDETFWVFFVLSSLSAIVAGIACIYVLQYAAPGVLRVLSGGRLGGDGARALPVPGIVRTG